MLECLLNSEIQIMRFKTKFVKIKRRSLKAVFVIKFKDTKYKDRQNTKMQQNLGLFL